MPQKYAPVLEHINAYWDYALAANYAPTRRTLGSFFMHLGFIRLPYPTVSPNDKYFAHTQFYWDTYFTVLGLVVAKRFQEARHMVENLCFLFEKFGYMPARNSWTSIGRSQPPYLTRMAFEIYNAGGADIAWLTKVMAVAMREYQNVWMSGRRYDEVSGLSRYNPLFWKRRLTVYESGWDSCARYNTNNYKYLIPVDLNCQLYQYEMDFARFARLKGKEDRERHWLAVAQNRQRRIEKYFWDESKGFYCDYNRKTQTTEQVTSLAGFYPLWCGAAAPERAERVRAQLLALEQKFGLSNTAKTPWRKQQWDYPNGWPPQQFITYEALKRYGFSADAERVARKWLDLNTEVFERNQKMWEKYDVVQGHVGWKGRYPTQAGFAWSNAIFLRLHSELEA